jgi:dienelactone hydrolase
MKSIDQNNIPHSFNGEELESVLVTDGSGQALPAVIIVPTVMGVTDLEIGFARDLVGRGYHALVADIFGKKFRGAERDVMFGEMNRLGSDRASLRERLLSILELARGEQEIDEGRIAVMGFCFGGKCALDLARSGADIAGAASFHGLFDPPGLPPQPIKAKVVAYHGWDDPMVPPEAVAALASELTEAGADWQIHAYGGVRHGFTNPGADRLGVEAVRYDALAAERSWTSLINFLEELFGDDG